MGIGGYNNRIAQINLSAAQVAYEPINPEYYKKYIGGRGMGVRLTFAGQPAVCHDRPAHRDRRQDERAAVRRHPQPIDRHRHR